MSDIIYVIQYSSDGCWADEPEGRCATHAEARSGIDSLVSVCGYRRDTLRIVERAIRLADAFRACTSGMDLRHGWGLTGAGEARHGWYALSPCRERYLGRTRADVVARSPVVKET